MSNNLTAEQQRKIEENRQKALAKRALRLAQASSINSQQSPGNDIHNAGQQQLCTASALPGPPNKRWTPSSSMFRPATPELPTRSAPAQINNNRQVVKPNELFSGHNSLNTAKKQVRTDSLIYFVAGHCEVLSCCLLALLVLITLFCILAADQSNRSTSQF